MEHYGKALSATLLSAAVTFGAYAYDNKAQESGVSQRIECFDRFEGSEEENCLKMVETEDTTRDYMGMLKTLGLVGMLAGGVQIYRRLEQQREATKTV